MTILGPAFMFEALQYGWDSLAAGIVLGLMMRPWRGRLVMALLFGVCDGGASLLGSAFSHRMVDIPDAAPFVLFSIVLALALCGRRNWLWTSPLLFSVDNFFSLTPPDHVAWLTFSSALLAWAGLSLGGLLPRAFRPPGLSHSADISGDRKMGRT